MKSDIHSLLPSGTGARGEAVSALGTTHSASRSLSRIYFLEAKYEFFKVIRMPAYAIPTITFPMVFYVMFGLSMGGGKGMEALGTTIATYLLATYGAFGVIGASLFGFGIGIAMERGQGWLEVKRATPMPIGAYFSAKIVMALIFSAIVVLGLFILGALFGDARLEALDWLQLFGVLIAGAIPFCALGLAIGYFAGPNSAPPIVNLIYLPMAFASGLWIPIDFLPNFVKAMAPWLPPYHLAQLALGTFGASRGGSPIGHLAALVGFTLLFLVLATIGYYRDEGKMYG